MSAFLKVKTHASVSQQKSSGRIKPFPTYLGPLAGDLDILMNPLALTSLGERSLILVCSESLETKSGENAKSAYSTETFVGASSAIKPTL